MTQIAINGFPSVDTIILGGDRMPGQWILQPTSKEYGWQVQKGWALAGATVRPIGDELVSASFLVRFHTAADWAAFQPFRRRYLAKALFTAGGEATYAIGIVHPELNALGVTAVVPRKVPAFTNNGKGLWTGTVEFLQYRKAVPVPESPQAAIPAAAAPAPSAADALEQEQQAHQEEVQGARG
jgi:hypothetical protein